jgi:hypothetical protein
MYPTGTVDDVSVKLLKSVSHFLFSGFRIIGYQYKQMDVHNSINICETGRTRAFGPRPARLLQLVPRSATKPSYALCKRW